MPTPAADGVTAKLNDVLRDVSVPPTERMPFARLAVTDAAEWLVPSTLKVNGPLTGAGDGVGVGVGVGAGVVAAGGVAAAGVGEVGPLPPPQAETMNAIEQGKRKRKWRLDVVMSALSGDQTPTAHGAPYRRPGGRELC